MLKRYLVCFLVTASLSLTTKAQNAGLVVSGCKMTVASSANIVIPGNISITGSTDEIISNGTINLSGNFTNNGSGFNTAGTGTLFFKGTVQQTIAGTGTMTFNAITVDNTATAAAKGVLLNSNITVGNALTLTTGPLILTGQTVTLNGGISHTNGSLTGSSTSNLVLNGSAAKALYFTSPGNVLHDLTINNTATSVSLDNALDITPGTAYGTVTCNGTLQTNGYLTLKSDINGTAAVGQSSGTINGNATMERFTDGSLNAGTSRRAWRLMTSPVSGTSIRQAWQESGVTTNTFGTLITGYNMPDAATASAQGYDFTGAGFNTSIRHYIPASDNWQALSSDGSSTGTLIPVRKEQAYLLFVRGDRTVFSTGSSIATLRATGTLLQGNQTVPITAGGYNILVGNPYPCTIDFASVYNHNSSLIQNQFYIWNSKQGIYGSYALVSYSGSQYVVTPSSFSTSNNDDYRYIPSSSGFLAIPGSSATTGNILIQESDKSAANVPPINPFRVAGTPTNLRQVVMNLNLRDTDTSATLADGFRAKFSADYEGSETDNSVVKAVNMYENLGLTRNSTDFIIEAKSEVKKTDTLYMKMWNIVKRRYQFQVRGDNFASAPAIRAWLEDGYLATKQELALDGSVVTINFEVNGDAGSSKSDRFRIVFENHSSALPVTITKITAQPKNGGAEVNWTVSNETNIKGYTVEKSADGGRTFTGTGTQQPARNNPQAAATSYSGYDAVPKNGDNYYRIRIEAKDGTVTYSTVVKVTIGGNGGGIQITLYPNPVREGKAALQLTNLKEGAYLVSVYSGSGQAVYQKKLYVTSANGTQTEPLLFGNTLAQGSYQVKVADSKGRVIFNDQMIVSR